MKAIISHDIDHITVSEHLFRDSIVPKFLIRSGIEYLTGKISFSEYLGRHGDLLKNKWNNIEELIAFNTANQIPSSFFIGVQNGLGLSYSKAATLYWTQFILNSGAEIGLHGIAFDCQEKIDAEYQAFKEVSKLVNFGTRMHYVRQNKHTFNYMQQAGYTYDSTEHAFKNPYKIGNMWEFPFQIMDGWVIEKGKRWQTQTIHQAKENTQRLIDQAFEKNLTYLGIDFHDRYFSKNFATWINWYTWLIHYLHNNKIPCINFNQAIRELES